MFERFNFHLRVLRVASLELDALGMVSVVGGGNSSCHSDTPTPAAFPKLTINVLLYAAVQQTSSTHSFSR